jgi:hypothetical protein
MMRSLADARAIFTADPPADLSEISWDRAHCETDQSWLVLYNSRKYLETGDSLHGLAGSVGLLVPKDERVRPRWLASTPGPVEQLTALGETSIVMIEG